MHEVDEVRRPPPFSRFELWQNLRANRGWHCEEPMTDKHPKQPWYDEPQLLAMPELVQIRDRLRRENLHDTEEPPLEKKPVPADLDPVLREE